MDVLDGGAGPTLETGSHAVDSLYRTIGMSAGRASTLDTALRETLATLCEQPEWAVGHVLRFGDGRFEHHWSASATTRFPAFRVATETWFASTSRGALASDELLSRTIGEGVLAFLDLRAASPAFERSLLARDAGLASAAALGVAAEGRPAAVLELYSEKPFRETGEMARLLEFVAGQLGQVASRDRMAAAVRFAAGHSRRLKEKLEEALARRQEADGEAELYDPLTSLPRRALLIDRLGHALRRKSRSPDRLFSLLAWRVRPGREGAPPDPARDAAVRKAVARRMAACLRPGDTLAHTAQDEFAILLEEVAEPERARGIAERIRTAVARPVRVAGRDVVVGHSIGITVARAGHDRPEVVLDGALSAARRAEREGSGICVL